MREARATLLCCTLLTILNATASPASAQDSGALIGTVTNTDKTPLHHVRVRLLATSLETESSSDGIFRLHGIPAGTYNLELRLLGFAVKIQPVTIESGATLRLPIELAASATAIDTVSIRAPAIPPHLRDFEERRARGSGRYFTREQIDKMHARQVTDVLRRIPGFQFQPSRTDGYSVQTGRTGTRICPIMYYINGSPFPVGADQTINSFVEPAAVDAIEVYSGSSSVPAQFNSTMYNTRCGVVVIWTRQGVDRSVK
jgi:hypothetical protein